MSTSTSVSAMEAGGASYAPHHQSCWRGRIVECGLGCGSLSTLGGAVAAGVQAYFSRDLSTRIIFWGISGGFGLVGFCMGAGAIKIEMDRPYVKSGKDVREMREQIGDIEGQVGELQALEARKSTLVQKLFKKVAADRKDAKQVLGKLSGLVPEFVKVRKNMEADRKRLVTDLYLQEVKSAVASIKAGTEESEGLQKKLAEKVDHLRTLFKDEKKELKELDDGRGKEIAVIKENRKLLKEFAANSGKADLDKLLGSLDQYQKQTEERTKQTSSLKVTVALYSANLREEKGITDKLTAALDMAKDKVALQESRDKLLKVLERKDIP
ncbi:MAG: hypothetical protein K1000chlam4_00909, partial [Chlamydiae bacterium]|nr:hypothetical protein [Chlamydiota bacterium]